MTSRLTGNFRQLRFEDVDGWAMDDLLPAMTAFLRSANHMVQTPYKTRALGISSDDLVAIAAKALQHAPFDAKTARQFFETNFTPWRISPDDGGTGFVTAYYEPVVKASRIKSADFPAPLYRRPLDLVDLGDSNRPQGLDPYFAFGKQTDDGIVEHPDRGEIQSGYLEGKGLELVYLPSVVEVFFIHIQGSAKLAFDDGTFMRVTYAAKTGHPYTPVGRIMRDRGDLPPDNVTMKSIKQWLYANPDRIHETLAHNRSFIFFAEVEGLQPEDGPLAAAKVPLTRDRSLAVDRLLHTFGVPIFIQTEKPLPFASENFAKLMIAQDTGSAIVGPARGDLFLGSGDEAGRVASDVKCRADFTVLVPNPANGNPIR